MPTKVFNVEDSGFGEGVASVAAFIIPTRITFSTAWTSATSSMGELLKSGTRFQTFDIFNLDIPVGATIRRATLERTLNIDFTNILDFYRVALLDPSPLHSQPVSSEDGVSGGVANWITKDATRDSPFVYSEVETIGEVYDAVPAATGDGPNSGADGGQFNIDTFNGMGTIGAAWTASSAYTLGQVRLRISRTAGGNPALDTDGGTSRPGVDLFIEVYDVISATDRRPTGSPIATSDAFAWDNLKIGITPTAAQSGWAIFTFTGGPTIALGTIHAYKLIVTGGGVLPLGIPFVRTAVRSTGTNTTAAGIWWGAGGWTAYPHNKNFPNVAENQPGGPLVAGRAFQDDECIIPLATVHVAGLRVWGHDIDSPGSGIDFPLDGTVPSTTNLVRLLQDWIGRVGYNPAGDRTAFIFDFLSSTDNLIVTFDTQEAIPSNPGMVLRVTFDDPVFAVRAVEKRVAIFPAEARMCRPDVESRSFAFPEAGKRTRTFDFEDRTARFPKDGRDKEFC